MATITIYSKSHGCTACMMNKKAFVKHGLAEDNGTELSSLVDGLNIKTVYIDQPENDEIREQLMLEGLREAPIVMSDFPAVEAGNEFDTFTGFQPGKVKALAVALEEISKEK